MIVKRIIDLKITDSFTEKNNFYKLDIYWVTKNRQKGNFLVE